MKTLLMPLLLLVTTMSYAQQLKLGNNPSVIQKSALLELESRSQGLLLPRITDTSFATLKSAPDGMIIYLTLNNSLSVRSNGKWESPGGISSLTLTRDLTGTGTGTVPATINNQAVSFAKMQNINTQKLLGRFAAGAGSIQEISLDNSLKLNTGGTLYADSALAIWNAAKLVGMRVSDKAPVNGEVLKWNGTVWESNTDNDGGATYGTLANNDISYADVAGSTTRMKIWASPVTGVVTNGPVGTGAHAWSVMAFKGNNGGFTTQLYFDKNTLAIKEWTGITGPLGSNPINGWYKTIMTNGNTNIVNGSIIFGNVTSDASSEVGQDNVNLYWNNTSKRLGVMTNTPNSSLSSNGSFSLPIRIFNSGTTTLSESDYTILKNAGGTATVTLPNASVCKGRIYVIKKMTGGSITINSSGGDVENATSVSMGTGTKYAYTFQSDGADWWIISGL